MSRRNWSYPEVQKALLLYLQIPFGQYHKGNPRVQQLAADIGRTPSAVAFKLGNLAALDDSIDQKGLSNGSQMDRQVWNDFFANPDTFLDGIEAMPTTAFPSSFPNQFAERQQHFEHLQSTDTRAATLTRRGQSLFRDAVLASYDHKCALTGVDDPRLLIASHIVPWADDRTSRLNPRNGLCLNALHDKAFDRHLITFDHDFTMQIRHDVPDATRELLTRGSAGTLRLPRRFIPDQRFLAQHRARFNAAA